MDPERRSSVAELQDGQKVEGVFLCSRKSLPTDRTGRRYLSLLLADRSGQVEALLWDEAERQAEDGERPMKVKSFRE